LRHLDTAGKARYDDAHLAIYEMAGLAGAQVDQAVTTVYTFVLGHALGTAAPVSLGRRLAQAHSDPEQAMRERLEQARQVARSFPRLRARLEAPSADYASGPEDSFEFGLDCLLNGIAARFPGEASRPE